MKRVVEVIADSTLSGAPRHLSTLVKKLKNKFDVVVICPQGWLAEELKRLGIKFTIVNFKSFSDFKSVSNLKSELRKLKPDLIHFHGVRAGWLGILATNGLKPKKIYTEHLYTFDYHLKNPLREKMQLFGLKKIVKSVDKIVVPSSAVETFLVGRLNILSSKIKIIPNGLEDYAITKKKSRHKIGFIGSLNEQKGISCLICAIRLLVRKFPDLCLEIIGEGPSRDRLQKESQDLEENIKFIGSVEQISPHLATWNLLVAPSLSESFGQVALEAAIAQLPIIATKVGGFMEVIEDGKTGILVDAGNAQDLANAIEKLLKSDKLCTEMGAAARHRYEKLYSADLMASEFEKLYKDILK